VLFINSLMDNRCMPWTWYIGTEFIFYLLSPIFLLSLRFRPNIGWALAIATISASCCLNTLCMIAYNFPPTQFLWRQPEIFNPDFVQHHMIIYIKPQYRIGPYIIGILLGYQMVRMQKRGDAAALTRRTLIAGWTFAICVGFWIIFGIWPSLQAWDWPFYHLFYGTVHRSLFALVISWLIFACHFGYAGWINAILSARFLIPLSNLCYSVYLFHMLPVVFTYLLDTFPMVYRSLWPLFGHVLAQLVMSYFFGLICALFAELPALNIERILLREKARRPPADVMVKLNALCEQPMIKPGN